MLMKKAADRASGIVAGFTSRWNPLARTVYVLVKVDTNTIKVPIDHRQMKFIQKEYDIGSRIELQFFCGDWHVMSRTQPPSGIPWIESDMSGQAPEIQPLDALI